MVEAGVGELAFKNVGIFVGDIVVKFEGADVNFSVGTGVTSGDGWLVDDDIGGAINGMSDGKGIAGFSDDTAVSASVGARVADNDGSVEVFCKRGKVGVIVVEAAVGATVRMLVGVTAGNNDGTRVGKGVGLVVVGEDVVVAAVGSKDGRLVVCICVGMSVLGTSVGRVVGVEEGDTVGGGGDLVGMSVLGTIVGRIVGGDKGDNVVGGRDGMLVGRSVDGPSVGDLVGVKEGDSIGGKDAWTGQVVLMTPR